ncbi:MAG TPA: DUF4199 domain-containing protein [Cyclobacteriaceae bacterium]|jgi:hypothetical protein|nr:DUF4199 domain-containing protein [Cyclobacteriaceae bacterium]
MNTKSPLFKVPFRWGLVGGVIASIVVAVLYFIGRHPFLLLAVFDFRIILFGVFIFFSLKELRDYHLQGLLFFWQGMIGSFVFITTSALIGSIFTWGFAKWNNNFLPSYIEQLQKQIISYKEEIVSSVGVETYNQQLAKLPLTSPMDLAGDYFLKSMIIGLFLAIVITTILRKQPKTN